MNHCNTTCLAGFWILLLGCLVLFHAGSVSSTEDKSLTEVTGVLHNEMHPMPKPWECDLLVVSQFKHFPGRPRWKKTNITYRITNYTSDLTPETVDVTIAKAFQLYSDVIPLNFRQIRSGSPDIRIFFVTGAHIDDNPFDGKGDDLAHAARPGKGKEGYIHFDEAETWTVTEKETNLLLVAAHEIGHSLGLKHNDYKSTLMYRSYNYVDTNGYKLPDGDRRGVQALYGRRPGWVEPTANLFPSPEDEQCKRTLEFDAATSFDEDLLFFKDGHYWRVCSKGIDLIKVNSKWPKINTVDAVYEDPLMWEVYLFEGAQYWGVDADTERVMEGYPKPLVTLGLPPSVTRVDAAVYVSSIKKTFIFSGSQYWRYDQESRKMDPKYPRDIKKDFPAVGSRVDAAFEHRGNVFLSNRNRQIEFNWPCRTVMRVLLNYGWLGCY